MIIRVGYPPFLMTREEAAYYLCISTRTLDGLQAQSKIIPKRLGGKRGFLREDLEEFARSLPDWEQSTGTIKQS